MTLFLNMVKCALLFHTALPYTCKSYITSFLLCGNSVKKTTKCLLTFYRKTLYVMVGVLYLHLSYLLLFLQ